MNSKRVDLAIIGSGSAGASIAYEATKRGLKVVLIDSGDIGGGTSSRSTKLLHGGVRYLELAFKNYDIAQLRLVREALLERGHWLQQVPFLATPLELALPSKNLIDKGYYRIGLGLYDALSGEKGIGSSRLISQSQLKKSLPLIKSNLSGGVSYKDGQFNDARLNIILALTAEKGGAIIRNYSNIIEFNFNSQGILNGVTCESYSGIKEYWEAKAIINATGIFADNIRKMVDKNSKPRLITSRGIHIVIEEELCPNGIGLLLPSTDDGRVLFALPFFNRTLIGTTDVPCSTQQSFSPSQEEKDYLISHITRWFPYLKDPTIRSVWAGGRPLLKPNLERKESSHLVREHEIEVLPCGLISSMGGKWTTCRKIAIDTLKAVETLLQKQLPKPSILPLIGANKDINLTKKLLIEQSHELQELLPKTNLLEKQLNHLQSNYGLNALNIIRDCEMSHKKPLSDIIPFCEAEILHWIRNEHAYNPTDLLARRCRLAMIDLPEAKRLLPKVQEILVREGFPSGSLNIEK